MWYSIVCVLFVLFNVIEATTPIKGLYCRDPDTGKLYPVDSTWQSESFCGNYTCKLRKKNFTETEYTPIAKINITKEHLKKINKPSNDDMSASASEHSHVKMKKIGTNSQPVFHKYVYNKMDELKQDLKNKSDDGDRYLTESEIKTITEILHSIKKSDLEAIVEIYNIAQEIYNEMDNTTEKFVEESIKNIKNEDIKIMKKPMNSKDSITYWYEPLHKQISTKNKPTDSTIEATKVIISAQPYVYPNINSKGLIGNADSESMHYYYPVSSFHRMSSYVHSPSYIPQQNIPKEMKPCKKLLKNYFPPTWYPDAKEESYKRASTAQPILLPYPFSNVHRYNYSYPANYYYNNNYPWAQLDVYNKNKNYPYPYYGAHVASIPSTAIITNIDEFNNKLEAKNDMTNDDKNSEEIKPDWQTEPLSAKVLEEVEANMSEKYKLLKPLSFRKGIKLEKVGKVIKLDELTRNRREIKTVSNKDDRAEDEKYEAYVEKTTCEPSTEPGFFRVGNETEPYPACCPQRISKPKKS